MIEESPGMKKEYKKNINSHKGSCLKRMDLIKEIEEKIEEKMETEVKNWRKYKKGNEI
jgi:hypothetical protein